MNRKDLTNWIIHFVHKRNSDNDPLEFSYDWDEMEYIEFPDNFSYTGEPMFQTSRYMEDDYGLDSEADAISVLKKILYDGIIKTGWSFRNGKATIYGPKSAACFTEMPLYALIQYSRSRNNENYIQPYGIAFLREELFEAGARPVIYGLSGQHIEAKEGETNFGLGFRILSEKCGIGIREMYRYVYTKINTTKKIDWTHEREWRWADLDEKFDFAGLPFFAENDKIKFSKIIVFVNSLLEAKEVIEYLQHLYDAKTTNFSVEYNLQIIENTYVLAIEELNKLGKNIDTIKFDDLPLYLIPKMQKVVVSDFIKTKALNALDIATEIYFKEAENIFKEKGDVGPCGSADIVTFDFNSEITQAFVENGFALSVYGKGYYRIYLKKGFPAQSIDVDESGKIAAAKYLTETLGQYFTTYTRWD